MNESKLLYDRINEVITICGSQKKLCDIANISPVILSRFKGYYKKNNHNKRQKR